MSEACAIDRPTAFARTRECRRKRRRRRRRRPEGRHCVVVAAALAAAFVGGQPLTAHAATYCGQFLRTEATNVTGYFAMNILTPGKAQYWYSLDLRGLSRATLGCDLSKGLTVRIASNWTSKARGSGLGSMPCGPSVVGAGYDPYFGCRVGSASRTCVLLKRTAPDLYTYTCNPSTYSQGLYGACDVGDIRCISVSPRGTDVRPSLTSPLSSSLSLSSTVAPQWQIWSGHADTRPFAARSLGAHQHVRERRRAHGLRPAHRSAVPAAVGVRQHVGIGALQVSSCPPTHPQRTSFTAPTADHSPSPYRHPATAARPTAAR